MPGTILSAFPGCLIGPVPASPFQQRDLPIRVQSAGGLHWQPSPHYVQLRLEPAVFGLAELHHALLRVPEPQQARRSVKSDREWPPLKK